MTRYVECDWAPLPVVRFESSFDASDDGSETYHIAGATIGGLELTAAQVWDMLGREECERMEQEQTDLAADETWGRGYDRARDLYVADHGWAAE